MRAWFWIGVLSGLLGCRPSDGTVQHQRTFTDDLGRTVTLPDTIRRVITLAPNLTEVVFTAGGEATVVGVSHADDYPPQIDGLPRYSTFPMDFEAMVALNPDVVLATDHVNPVRDAETFATLGIPTLFFRFDRLADVPRNIQRVGTLLGTEATAMAAVTQFEARLAALDDALDEVTERPRVLFLIGDDVLYAFGKESYVHEMLSHAGGASITAGLEARPILSDEFVLNARPDVILGSFGEDYDAATLLRNHPTWSILPVFEQGRVHGINPDWVLRPGPRLIDGVYAIAAHLHPKAVQSLLSNPHSPLP